MCKFKGLKKDNAVIKLQFHEIKECCVYRIIKQEKAATGTLIFFILKFKF